MSPPAPADGGRPSRWRERIDRRLARIPRYRRALVESMSHFGDDFEADAFVAAYESDDPATINLVTAVEGDLGHIVNWLRQIADLGYHELTRLDRIETSDAPPLEVLVGEGLVSAADRERLEDLVRLRNRLQHDYPAVTPREIHGAVGLLLDLLPGLTAGYGRMLERIDG